MWEASNYLIDERFRPESLEFNSAYGSRSKTKKIQLLSEVRSVYVCAVEREDRFEGWLAPDLEVQIRSWKRKMEFRVIRK